MRFSAKHFQIRKADGPTSALGHLRTCPAQDSMSARPLKPDIRPGLSQVRFGGRKQTTQRVDIQFRCAASQSFAAFASSSKAPPLSSSARFRAGSSGCSLPLSTSSGILSSRTAVISREISPAAWGRCMHQHQPAHLPWVVRHVTVIALRAHPQRRADQFTNSRDCHGRRNHLAVRGQIAGKLNDIRYRGAKRTSRPPK
jgi:hypothetical protein